MTHLERVQVDAVTLDDAGAGDDLVALAVDGRAKHLLGRAQRLGVEQGARAEPVGVDEGVRGVREFVVAGPAGIAARSAPRCTAEGLWRLAPTGGPPGDRGACGGALFAHHAKHPAPLAPGVSQHACLHMRRTKCATAMCCQPANVPASAPPLTMSTTSTGSPLSGRSTM